SLVIPRGHTRSTSTREPSPGVAGSYARLSRMLSIFMSLFPHSPSTRTVDPSGSIVTFPRARSSSLVGCGKSSRACWWSGGSMTSRRPLGAGSLSPLMLPDPQVHVLEAGYFALDTAADEIAALTLRGPYVYSPLNSSPVMLH